MSIVTTQTTQTMSRAEIAVMTHLFKVGDISPIVSMPAPADIVPRHNSPDWADNLAILVAHIIGNPLDERHQPKVKATCGRFVQVEYTPLRQDDPDIIVCLSQGAAAFHRAMMKFQEARSLVDRETRRSKFMSLGEWYTAAKKAAMRLIEPLRLLGVSQQEFLFVMRWALLCCTYRHTT